MTRHLTVLLAVVTLALGAVSSLLAGECVDNKEVYVAALEGGPKGGEFDYAVYCLGSNPIVMGRLWAGPMAADQFKLWRSDGLRPRIHIAVSALLRSSWAESAEHRHELLRIAARHGIGRLDSLDVYNELVDPSRPLDFGIYEDLAILQDCRAVDFMRTRYEQLRRGAEEAYPEEVLELLSCLYHIPCKRAVAVALDLRSKETDRALRERLRRVVDRK